MNHAYVERKDYNSVAFLWEMETDKHTETCSTSKSTCLNTKKEEELKVHHKAAMGHEKEHSCMA